jgi:hypothetical protein
MGWLLNRTLRKREAEIAQWQTNRSFPPMLVCQYPSDRYFQEDANRLLACGYVVTGQNMAVAQPSERTTWHVTYTHRSGLG